MASALAGNWLALMWSQWERVQGGRPFNDANNIWGVLGGTAFNVADGFMTYWLVSNMNEWGDQWNEVKVFWYNYCMENDCSEEGATDDGDDESDAYYASYDY